MNVQVIRTAAGPERDRADERAAMLAEQAASMVEYVAMMTDVELPQDEQPCETEGKMGDE